MTNPFDDEPDTKTTENARPETLAPAFVAAGSSPDEHEHTFEFRRFRTGKPGTPNYMFACDCGERDWRFEK